MALPSQEILDLPWKKSETQGWFRNQNQFQNVPFLSASLGLWPSESREGRAPEGLDRYPSKADPIPLLNKHTGTGLIQESLTVTKSKKIVGKIGEIMENGKNSNSTLHSKTVSSNSTPDMCFWMCFYLLSLISLFWLRVTYFFLVIYASYILHCVSNAKENFLYCHVFGTSLHSAPQAQEVPAQVHYNMRSPSWMGTWDSTWAEVTAKLQHISCNTCAVHVTLKCPMKSWMMFYFVRNLHEIMSVFPLSRAFRLRENGDYFHRRAKCHEHTELYRWVCVLISSSRSLQRLLWALR